MKFEKLLEQFKNEEMSSSNDMTTVKSNLNMTPQQKDLYMKHFKLKEICDCGYKLKMSKGKYPTKCPNCGASLMEKIDNIEESEKSKEYQDFYKSVLKKFGVTEPDQLDDKKKKEFFNYIDDNYNSEKEAGKDGIKESEEKTKEVYHIIVTMQPSFYKGTKSNTYKNTLYGNTEAEVKKELKKYTEYKSKFGEKIIKETPITKIEIIDF